MAFGLDSCLALTRTHLTVCSSPKLKPRIYLSSVMKHLSKATGCDAFGEKETIRWRNVGSVLEVARPEGFEPPTLCSGGTRSIHLSYGRAVPGLTTAPILPCPAQGGKAIPDRFTDSALGP